MSKEIKYLKRLEATLRAIKASIENGAGGGVTDVAWLDCPVPTTICDEIESALGSRPKSFKVFKRPVELKVSMIHRVSTREANQMAAGWATAMNQTGKWIKDGMTWRRDGNALRPRLHDDQGGAAYVKALRETPCPFTTNGRWPEPKG